MPDADLDGLSLVLGLGGRVDVVDGAHDVNSIVPWALGEIGDGGAIGPLIEALDDPDPSMRVPAIYALETLHATEAPPRLTALVNEQATTHFGAQVSVAEAAKAAIGKLSSPAQKP